MGRTNDRVSIRVRARQFVRNCLGGHRSGFSLLRHVAAGGEYGDDARHISRGLSHTHSQNKDGRAIQLKLDELIRSTETARNMLIDLEHCTDEELERLQKEFSRRRHT
jgi:hypothetical protein